jgi:hypothetical protein
MRNAVCSLCVFVWTVVAAHAGPTLVNGDFERNGGAFNIPSGWVPFGTGKFEGAWQGNWHLQLADVFPGHRIGLYQVVPDTVPGVRYRLTAQASAGSNQLPVRIGLVPAHAAQIEDGVWSPFHESADWAELSTECVADGPLTVVLEMVNRNPDHQLLQAGRFDDVRLEPEGSGPLHVEPEPDKPQIAPAHDVYAGLANLWSLAWPKPGVRTRMAGTHHPDSESNADFDRYESTLEQDGVTWNVLTTLDGPGAITRIWMTHFARDARLRIVIDGRVAIDEPAVDFFGSPVPLTPPLNNATSGAWMSYTPMPFGRRARLLIHQSEQERFYWQVTWQQFESGTKVRALTWPLNPIDAEHWSDIQRQWRLASVDPKPEWPGSQVVKKSVHVPAHGEVSIWSDDEPGLIQAIHIDLPGDAAETWTSLRLTARWDGASQAQVDAPLGLFFAAPSPNAIVRGLLVGVTPPFGGYCYFPMPYRAADIRLRSDATHDVRGVRVRVHFVPLPREPSTPLRLCARYVHDPHAGAGELFVPLEIQGRGQLVGLSAAMSDSKRESFAFLEGDEYIHVDGESEPSIAGTGTEDYFTCGWYFSAGPITLAPIGVTVIDKTRWQVNAYRFHVPDWIPFTRSLLFGIEVGDRVSNPIAGDYRLVLYSYEE